MSTFLGVFTTGNFPSVQGLTTKITAVGVRAYKKVDAHAYSTVFYASVAFSWLAIVIVSSEV